MGYSKRRMGNMILQTTLAGVVLMRVRNLHIKFPSLPMGNKTFCIIQILSNFCMTFQDERISNLIPFHFCRVVLPSQPSSCDAY